MKIKSFILILAVAAMIYPIGTFADKNETVVKTVSNSQKIISDSLAFVQNTAVTAFKLFDGLTFDKIGSGGMPASFSFDKAPTTTPAPVVSYVAPKTSVAAPATMLSDNPNFSGLTIRSMNSPGIVKNDAQGHLIGGQKIDANDISGLTASKGLNFANGSLSLDTNIPTSVSSDTNLKGSIANGVLSLAWSGVLPVNRGGTGIGFLGKPGQVLAINSNGTGFEYVTVNGGITGGGNNVNIPSGGGSTSTGTGTSTLISGTLPADPATNGVILTWDNVAHNWQVNSNFIVDNTGNLTTVGTVDGVDVSNIPGLLVGKQNNLIFGTGGGVDADMVDGFHAASFEGAIVGSGLATDYFGGDKTFHALDANAVGLGNVLNVAQLPATALDTNTALGNSDLLVSSQKAVKTYVDNGITASDATDAANLAAGLLTANNNLTTGLATANTNLTNGLATKENTIAGGTAAQVWNGLKNWITLDTSNVVENVNQYFTEARALASRIAGVFTPNNSAIVTGDTVQQALEKAQGQINNKVNLTAIDTDGNLTANSDANVASQKATKTYVDATATTANNNLTAGLTAAAATTATNLTNGLATKENTIAGGTAAQVWNGLKNWITLDANAVGLGNVLNVAQLPATALDTNTALGNSDLLVSSQKAVKTYVDNGITASDATDAANLAAGLLTANNNLTTGLATANTNLTNGLATKENTIAGGTAAQVWNGLKNWITLDTSNVVENVNQYFTEARALASRIAGVFTPNNSAIVTGDTVQQALEKAQGQINNKVNLTAIDTDGNLTANSDANVASQKATKTYVDAAATTANNNLTTGLATANTNLTNGLATKENTIAGGTAAQVWNGLKNWITLDANAVGLGNVSNVAQLPATALDTNTALGNSDALVSSQKAVKTYVDNGITASDATDAANLAAGLLTANNNLTTGLATANTNLTNGLATKQDTLVAGNSISIAGANIDTAQDIRNTATPTFAGLVFNPSLTPAIPIRGQSYYDSSDDTLRYWTGAGWAVINTGGTPSGDLIAGNGVALSASGANKLLNVGNLTLSINFNPTNLKMNGAQLDTIQDISNTATPTFAGLTMTGTSGILKSTAGVVSGSANTDDLPEGANKYFSNTLARNALTSTAPIAYDSLTGTFSIAAANGATDGYLTSANWTLFNSKEPAIATGAAGQYWDGNKTWQALDATAVGLGNVLNVAQIPASALDTDNTLAANLDTNVVSQKAVKTYVDNGLTAVATTTATNLTAGLATKENAIAGGTAAQVWNGLKQWITLDANSVGLGNVTDVAQLPMSYLSTSTNLITLPGGPSDTKVPSQKAVKTYVDSASTTTNNNLVTGLATKQGTISLGLVSQYYRGDKTWATLDNTTVGLNNVLNVAQIPASALDTNIALGNSDALVSSQKAVKTYVDNGLTAAANTTATNLAAGLATANTNLTNGLATAAATTATNLTAGLAIKENAIAGGTAAQVWNGLKQWITLDANAVGLVNVTNDAQLPMSYLSTSTTLGGIPSDTKVPSQKAVKVYADAVGTVANNNLATGLATKQNTIVAGLVSQYYRGDKTWAALDATAVGLNNVLNVAQIPASALDTDIALAANSDAKVASQKAVKTYVDTNITASNTSNAANIATGLATANTNLVNGLATKENTLTKGNTTTPNAAISIVGGTGAIIGAGLTIDVRNATTAQSGLLTSADWNTFNNKQNALTLGNATSPNAAITITGGTGAIVGSGLSIDVRSASAAQSGILTAADWNIFNNKEGAITAGTVAQYFRGDKTWQTLDANAVGLGNVTNVAQLPLSYLSTLTNLGGIPSDTKVPSQRAVKVYADTVSVTANNNLITGLATKQNTLTFGTGGGVDADMLDGKHATDFLSSTGGTISGALTTSIGDANSTVLTGMTINRSNTTGTGAAGLGTSLAFNLENASSIQTTAGEISTAWSNLNAGNETSTLNFKTWQSGWYQDALTITGGSITMPGVYSSTVGTTNRDLYIDNTGKIGYVSSSIRYKTDINAMENIDWLYALEPVNYVYKSDASGMKQYGLIAEDVQKVNPLFVSFNADGTPETVSYSSFIPVLIKAAQDQNAKIEGLTTTTDELGLKLTATSTSLDTALTTIKTQQDEIDSLKQDIQNLGANISNVAANASAPASSEQVVAAPEVTTTSSDSDIVNLTNALNGLTGDVNTLKLDMAAFKNAIAINAVSGDATFAGHILVNNDVAGNATIKIGDTKIEVNFAKPYVKAPIVNTTPTEFVTGQYKVTEITANGFTIEVSEAQAKDLQFNWTALGSN